MNKIILAVALLLTVSGHVAGQTSYLSEIGIEKNCCIRPVIKWRH